MSNSDSSPLIIARPNEDVAIEIRDAFDRVIAAPLTFDADDTIGNVHDTTFGQEIKLDVPPGLYSVRGELGGQRKERVVRVQGISGNRIDAPTPPRITPVAYEGAASSHEYYSEPAVHFSKHPTRDSLTSDKPADAWFFLFVRGLDQNQNEPVEQVASKLLLETPDGRFLRGEEDSEVDATHGWLALSFQAAAGDYLLHYAGSEPRTLPVTLYDGWQTQLFIMLRKKLQFNSLRVFFSRKDVGFRVDDETTRAVDLALSSLLTGRASLPARMRSALLNGKFDNPMLGLIGAWAVIRDIKSRRQLSPMVVDNLEGLLPGSPDVAAVRVARSRRSGETFDDTSLERMPMIRTAVSELTDAEAERGGVLGEASRLNTLGPRFYNDCAWTSWQPLPNDFPAAPIDSPLRMHLESKAEDPIDWVQTALLGEIELDMRRRRGKKTDKLLNLSQMAQRMGLTPSSLNQVIQQFDDRPKSFGLTLQDSQEGTLRNAAESISKQSEKPSQLLGRFLDLQ